MDAVLRRRALAPLLLGFVGPVPPRWLLDALHDGLGGVVLFASNLTEDPAALTATLRDAAGRDIVVALDEEGGDVTRLDARVGSASPGAAALGFRDDLLATRVGVMTAGPGGTLKGVIPIDLDGERVRTDPAYIEYYATAYEMIREEVARASGRLEGEAA